MTVLCGLTMSGIARAEVAFSPTFSAEGSPTALADFDSDGNVDLAVARDIFGENARADIYLGSGDGLFTSDAQVDLGIPFAMGLGAGRFNGDAHSDLAAVYSTDSFGNGLSVVAGDGQGQFASADVQYPDGFPTRLVVGDFNADAQDDFILIGGTVCVGGGCETTGFPVYLGGTAPVSVAGSVDAPESTRALGVGDLNGDGDLDVVAATGDGQVAAFLGDGTGDFAAGGVAEVGGNFQAVAIGELTGDGSLDVAVIDEASASLKVVSGNGAGGFGSTFQHPLQEPAGVAIADFDRNGREDVAVGQSDPARVTVLSGNGTGGFPSAQDFGLSGSLSAEPHTVVARDVTADPKADLVVTTYDGVTVLVNGTESGDEALLAQYSPVLRYDSQESYRADSAATMTDNYIPNLYANTLKRNSFDTLASADPDDPPPTLSLDFLGSGYDDDMAGDFLDVVDENDLPPAVPAVDAIRLHLDGEYANKTYGRVVRTDGRTILQYWLFYYMNPRTFFGVGDHEGDWELVQVELDPLGAPAAATYSQHDDPERCEWDRVEKDELDRPVVYVAEGAHANYFSAGQHDLSAGQSDRANGLGETAAPTPIDVTITPSWFAWPGRWGASMGTIPPFGGESPRGPTFQGDKWTNPLAWSGGADDCTSALNASAARPSGAQSALAPPPLPESLVARRVGRRAVVTYAFGAAPLRARPWQILASVDNETDDRPPLTVRTRVQNSAGTISIPLKGTDERTVLVSVRAESGVSTQVVRLTI